MVYNIFSKDIDMRHDEYIKVMYRIDSVKKEINSWNDLLLNLIEEPDYESHYAAHRNTAIVYDKRIIGDNLTRLNQEMDDLEKRLSDEKY